LKETATDGRWEPSLGIRFNDARIARVRITSGDVAPGPDDDAKNDIVVMDDFIYGEPQPFPKGLARTNGTESPGLVTVTQ
jgi:hypothetical protein